MDFLQQKEEIENKIKNVNNYWDDLKIKQQEKEKKKEKKFLHIKNQKNIYMMQFIN